MPMSLLQRATLSTLRNFKPKRGGGGGSFWSQGKRTDRNGYLFNETPPPPGESRKWEGWEAPWYTMLVGSFAILSLGLSSKPDTSLVTWARKEAEKELKEEGVL